MDILQELQRDLIFHSEEKGKHISESASKVGRIDPGTISETKLECTDYTVGFVLAKPRGTLVTLLWSCLSSPT